MTQYETNRSVFPFDGGWLTHVVVDTDVYVRYSALDGMSVGEVLDHFNAAIEFVKGYEDSDVDPHSIRFHGQSVMQKTLALSYNVPATDEEIAEHQDAKLKQKQERRAWLLEELKELEEA